MSRSPRPHLLRSSLVTLLLVAGCSGASTHVSGETPSGSASGPTSGAAATYVNPLYDENFPDPAVLQDGTTWHAYATQGAQKNIQTLTSTDLVHWRPGPDALPDVGRWGDAGNTWAPEVIKLGSGFTMYYVAHDTTSGKQCIGRATSVTASGPFIDRAPRPLVCQPGLGGSIDPDPVRAADGGLYLYWKNDGNCCGRPVHLWGQRLSADGAAVRGSPVALMTNAKAWEGSLVEAPEMVVHDGHYVLFYSANDYASTRYGMGYASCRGPLGPCTDRSDVSLVPSNDVAVGPGHCFVLQLPAGRWWMLYHAWLPDAVGTQSPGRVLWLEPLTWSGDRPVVHPSAVEAQPAPTATP
jgi:beta-xylosidase